MNMLPAAHTHSDIQLYEESCFVIYEEKLENLKFTAVNVELTTKQLDKTFLQLLQRVLGLSQRVTIVLAGEGK